MFITRHLLIYFRLFNGWHFYTRLVQLKFVKDSIHNYHLIKHSDISIEILRDTLS